MFSFNKIIVFQDLIYRGEATPKLFIIYQPKVASIIIIHLKIRSLLMNNE